MQACDFIKQQFFIPFPLKDTHTSLKISWANTYCECVFVFLMVYQRELYMQIKCCTHIVTSK